MSKDELGLAGTVSGSCHAPKSRLVTPVTQLPRAMCWEVSAVHPLSSVLIRSLASSLDNLDILKFTPRPSSLSSATEGIYPMLPLFSLTVCI